MYSKANRWTPEQDARLAAMRTQGFGPEAIALAVGHSKDACVTRMSALGLSKREKRPAFHRETYASPASEAKTKGKRRPCLCCTKLFWSTGPGNRLCGNCRQISVSPLAMPARVLR
jgi:hypothetical protein